MPRDAERPRVIDAAPGKVRKESLPRLSAGLIAFAFAMGAAVAIAVRVILRVYTSLAGLVWTTMPSLLAIPLYPVLACVIGGILIGLWHRAGGPYLDSLEEVISKTRSGGGYRLAHPLGSVISFLLPLVFGGSVGPEAGASGIIAAAASWVGAQLKHAGVAAVRLTDVTVSAVITTVFGTPLMGIVASAEDPAPDYERFSYRRWPKAVLYAFAGAGALLGAWLFSVAFGAGEGLPRFDAISAFDVRASGWLAAFLVVGYLLAQLFRVSGVFVGRLLALLGDNPLARSVACGLALGIIALALPDVLFSGEAQTSAVMGDWQRLGAASLLATGAVKLVATQACLSAGWTGGSFFPMIFSGVSVGYGLAVLTGVDPLLSVVVVTTALVAAATRKPLLAISVLALCFPLVDLPVMALAAFAAGKAPSMPLPGEGSRGGRGDSSGLS